MGDFFVQIRLVDFSFFVAVMASAIVQATIQTAH